MLVQGIEVLISLTGTEPEHNNNHKKRSPKNTQDTKNMRDTNIYATNDED